MAGNLVHLEGGEEGGTTIKVVEEVLRFMTHSILIDPFLVNSCFEHAYALQCQVKPLLLSLHLN